jgi:cell division protein FtsB
MSAQKTSRKNESNTVGPNRRPLIFVLIILSLLFTVSYTARLGKLARMRAQVDVTAQKIEDARLRQAALLDEQEYVKSDRFVDDVARGEMGMGQPGEILVVGVGEAAGSGEEDAVLAPPSTEDPQVVNDDNGYAPIWRQWMALFIQPAG